MLVITSPLHNRLIKARQAPCPKSIMQHPQHSDKSKVPQHSDKSELQQLIKSEPHQLKLQRLPHQQISATCLAHKWLAMTLIQHGITGTQKPHKVDCRRVLLLKELQMPVHHYLGCQVGLQLK